MTSTTRTPETAVPPVAAVRQRTAATGVEAVVASHENGAAHARSQARPWWFDMPAVAMACAKVAVAPLVAVVRLAEAAVAIALLAALATAFAWHQGYIADKDVVATLKPVGQRLLAMVQSAGTQ